MTYPIITDFDQYDRNTLRHEIGQVAIRSAGDPVALLLDFRPGSRFIASVLYNYNTQALAFRIRRHHLPNMNFGSFATSNKPKWHIAEDDDEFFGCVTEPRAIHEFGQAHHFAKRLAEAIVQFQRSLTPQAT